MKRILAVGITFILFLSTMDMAGAKAPATLQGYVTYCQQAANLGDCWGEVQISDVAINAVIVFAKGTGPGSCAPEWRNNAEKEQTERDGIQKVLAWIQAHPAML